jgi:hypothetical protein
MHSSPGAPVKDERARIGDRTADRNRPRAPRRNVAAHVERARADCRLRGPVVVEHATEAGLEYASRQRPRQRLPTGDQPAPRQDRVNLRTVEKCSEVRRRDLENIDRMLGYVASVEAAVHRRLRAHEVQRAARAQGREKARIAEIRRDRGDEGEGVPLLLGRAEFLRDVGRVVRNVRVRHGNPFRHSRRSGRVHQVEQVVRLTFDRVTGRGAPIEVFANRRCIDRDDLAAEVAEHVGVRALSQNNR